MSKARDEQGFVLVTAIMIMFVVLGLGLGLLLFADNQQKASAGEQARETAFNLAEAALNAQIGQISRAWPSATTTPLPAACTAATSTATNGCPDPASLSAGYAANTGIASCGSATEPWGSSLANKWTTYVRDDVEGSSVFNSGTEQGLAPSDANNNGKLWVRAVGVSQCHAVSIVTLVSRQLVTISFPEDAATGNWFKVTNTGKKVIVNTAGVPAVGQAGAIAMRCAGIATEAECKSWDKSKEQVNPDTTNTPGVPSPIYSDSQLAVMKATAISAGTFHSAAAGNCPTSLEQLSGLPAYVEGCGELKLTGGIGNSAASPGFLVLGDGTIELKWNAEFYGVIYAHNPSNLTGAVVTLGGTAQVFGAIDVDGPGGIEFGSSKANLIYDPKAIKEVKAYAGATPTRNTFRVLPGNQ